jgi:hypothetical protein
MSGLARLTLVAGVVALAGCGGSVPGPTAAATAARTWIEGYPNSIAVLGHSGGTGESSDPKQPGVEVRENSWATGTNPDVRSIYLRILEHNPEIEGHAINLSMGGGNVYQLAVQAEDALASDPVPELMLIQIMDNDMTCPARASELARFRSLLTAVLRKLATGAPSSRQFVVSQFGSVATYAKTLTREERASQSGTGPCDFMTPSGGVAPHKVARLERAVHAYESQLAAACQAVRQCTYDGGAFGRTVDQREYLGSDLNHFSITGHGKAAAVAWAAMRRTRVLPRDP